MDINKGYGDALELLSKTHFKPMERGSYLDAFYWTRACLYGDIFTDFTMEDKGLKKTRFKAISKGKVYNFEDLITINKDVFEVKVKFPKDLKILVFDYETDDEVIRLAMSKKESKVLDGLKGIEVIVFNKHTDTIKKINSGVMKSSSFEHFDNKSITFTKNEDGGYVTVIEDLDSNE